MHDVIGQLDQSRLSTNSFSFCHLRPRLCLSPVLWRFCQFLHDRPSYNRLMMIIGAASRIKMTRLIADLTQRNIT